MRLFNHFFVLLFAFSLKSESPAMFDEKGREQDLLLHEQNVDYGKKAVRIPSNIQRIAPPVPQIVIAPPAEKSELCEALTDATKPDALEDNLHTMAMDLCNSLKDAEAKNFGTKYRACTAKSENALKALLDKCFAKKAS